MNIKKLNLKFYKFLFYYFERWTKPDFFNRILKMEGFEIGEGTIFYGPKTMTIDRERPWMLKIGSYCKITSGVSILTHDYSRSVLRRVYGDIIGEAGLTQIGNNVFIGVNSVILMGTKIGDNVIVGAGSVVSGTVPPNVVIAGNPAKIVRTLDEHYLKRKENSLKEAVVFFKSYKERYGVWPSEKYCGPFYPLFANRETFDYNDPRLRCNGDNVEEIRKDFRLSKPLFASYEDFIDYVEKQKDA